MAWESEIIVNAEQTSTGLKVGSEAAGISCGHLKVSSGRKADNTAINSGGSMTIYTGGIANSTTVNGYENSYIYGIANNTTVNGYESIIVYSGATANNTTPSH